MIEGKDEVQISDLPPRQEEMFKQPRRGKGFLRETFEIAKILLISLAIVVPIRYFIVQPFIVRGASMEPNFYDGQYLIIDEATYNFRRPTRGEVIVFRYPRDPGQFFIKRIIGLPGERIRITKGRVMIFNSSHPDGMLLNETYLVPTNRPTYPDEEKILTSSEYFLMGDNRDSSSDSRVWGPMDVKFMIGRTLFRAWPLDSFGFITH